MDNRTLGRNVCLLTCELKHHSTTSLFTELSTVLGAMCVAILMYMLIYISHIQTTFHLPEVGAPYSRISWPDNKFWSPRFRNQNGTISGPNKETCTDHVSNLAFVKVHKTGSTTVMNIFQRFAYKRNLTSILPLNENPLLESFINTQNISRDNKYNMLIYHVHHYDRETFQGVLYPDTKYIGIVREPLSRTVSAFHYYRSKWSFKLYKNICGENPLQEYLNNREMYESGVDAFHSFTNNRMSFDFGLPQRDFRNISVIQKFIEKIDSEFDLVMIMEYFVESLVFLRRLLCWDIKDVLFIKRNANPKKYRTEFTQAERDNHRNFSLADNLLYDHFLEKFKQRLIKQDEEFFEEADILLALSKKVTDYCNAINSIRFEPSHGTLHISQSKFSAAFDVGPADCHLMLLRELDFIKKTRNRQQKAAFASGI